MAKSEYNSRVGPVGFTVNTVGAELMVGENDMDGAKVTGTEERGGGGEEERVRVRVRLYSDVS